MLLDPLNNLSDWQQNFISKFLTDRKRRSRLVAAPGTGKTTVGRRLIESVLRDGDNEHALVINHHRAATEYWKSHSAANVLMLGDKVEDLRTDSLSGIAVSSYGLPESILGQDLLTLSGNPSLMVLVDEAENTAPGLANFVEQLLSVNERSRVLYLSSHNQQLGSDGLTPYVDTEYTFEQSIIALPDSRIAVAKQSPSYGVLDSLLLQREGIEALSWRQFERLIADLLEADGYSVELMQGTKDGGVDVIAVKDLGPAGSFKTLWQAKKKSPGNKVGLSVVRELADTRNEFGASKAIIVTSTYLTRGAIQRIQRDRHLLGKQDRDDLIKWMNRVLREGLR